MAETGDRNDPYSGFNFLIEITDVYPKGSDIVAGFSEVSGLDTETDLIEYRNGNEEITVRKLPGLRKFTHITLKRRSEAHTSELQSLMRNQYAAFCLNNKNKHSRTHLQTK